MATKHSLSAHSAYPWDTRSPALSRVRVKWESVLVGKRNEGCRRSLTADDPLLGGFYGTLLFAENQTISSDPPSPHRQSGTLNVRSTIAKVRTTKSGL